MKHVWAGLLGLPLLLVDSHGAARALVVAEVERSERTRLRLAKETLRTFTAGDGPDEVSR